MKDEEWAIFSPFLVHAGARTEVLITAAPGTQPSKGETMAEGRIGRLGFSGSVKVSRFVGVGGGRTAGLGR
ncbi:hypothetical protein ABB55_04270 [Prosthecomicrobium hirschii]|uniref:Uncharacterized protein n=1 Tax=Prosthecodimorpha hirschii TaxID=665126 RepID=A0A0P6W0T7_9HYPH|nr:hypothetical protein ABB55_04270 [Prosthecomicrobium hirschii]